MIKVVDIFAGPGGLGEGFSSVTDNRGRPAFDVVLSVEMDRFAFETLRLRTFFRQFSGAVPTEYYRHLRGEITREEMYAVHEAEAERAAAQCWHARLGPGGASASSVRRRIDAAVGRAEDWVLIGGPPCQAYSLVGRSRNKGNPEYDPKRDVRQHLYVEYLQILADHRPAVFIMENVKGLLSATVGNVRMFQRILNDLRAPGVALKRDGRPARQGGGYTVYSLVDGKTFDDGSTERSVVQAERHGIPQARHRVILLGIREDLSYRKPPSLVEQPAVNVHSVIGTMPRLRSGLSKLVDSPEAWRACLREQHGSRWANAGACKAGGPRLRSVVRRTLRSVEPPSADRGGEFVACNAIPAYAPEWFVDAQLGGVCNHTSRGHMTADLFRYMFAACFAHLHGRSPSLRNFPTDLLPDHDSVGRALESGSSFSDRFRVQIATRPSTTIVSHIGRDGHYYIHPDPTQCRSLTVREAARLQTFRDNYCFCGPRTAQYVQVGNAVPPLLARQIAEIVLDTMKGRGIGG